MVLLQFAVFAGISDGLSIHFGWVLLLLLFQQVICTVFHALSHNAHIIGFQLGKILIHIRQRRGRFQQYHASCHLNERCRDEIDAALAQRFDGMQLGAGAVEQVVAEYGLERTKYVLAAAIQTRDGDGRISRTNREWEDSIRTIKDIDRRGFDRSCYYADLQAHTCLLDGFVNQVRKFEKAKAQPAQDTPER